MKRRLVFDPETLSLSLPLLADIARPGDPTVRVGRWFLAPCLILEGRRPSSVRPSF